jgi:hypothetical protein
MKRILLNVKMRQKTGQKFESQRLEFYAQEFYLWKHERYRKGKFGKVPEKYPVC